MLLVAENTNTSIEERAKSRAFQLVHIGNGVSLGEMKA